MEIGDLLMQGVGLLIIGMGTVFVFLAFLVLAVTAMSRIAQRFEVAVPAAPVQWTAQQNAPSTSHIAAISAAVRRYRADRDA